MNWRELKWRNCGPPASEQEVTAVEREIGVEFPADFRECLKSCHGGTPSPFKFSFEDPDIGIMESGLSILLSLDPATSENLVETYRLVSPVLPTGAVPFGDDGGGDMICLDYSRAKQPSVAYWHQGEARVIPLADSFASFVNMLY